MKLAAAYNVPGPAERVFDALTDPDILCRCIEGCESFVRQEDGTYQARIRIGLGSIKGTFTGQARMHDVQRPESYTLSVEGRGTPGFVNGTARMKLAPDGETTAINCDADVSVGGVIAAVGSRLIEVTAKRMMDKFFENLRQQFDART